MRTRFTAAAIATALTTLLSAPAAPAQDAPPPAAAQPELDGFLGQRVRLTLTNGEVVRGELTALKDGVAVIQHPIFGDIAIARAMVAQIVLDEQPNATIPAPQPSAEEPPPEAVPPTPKSFLEGWKGTVEFGLNGSSGNTERVNLRAGLGAARKTDETDTTLNFTYTWARDDGNNTENRARLDARNDWLLGDGPWRLFAKGSFEFDDFQEWDTRASLFGGVGYEFIDTSDTFLLGRIGAGITREFGGDDTGITPEGLLGLDFRHALTERQQINATAEFLPDLEDIGAYRALARASYDILIDPEANLKLKLGVEDRYDSDPGGDFKRNDFDYFALIAWEF